MVYYWFKSLSHRLIASHIAILSQSCFILYTVVVSGNEMGVCPVGDVCARRDTNFIYNLCRKIRKCGAR